MKILDLLKKKDQPQVVRLARPDEIVLPKENPLVEKYAPPVIQVERDYIIVGDTYMRAIYVSEWPKALSKQQWMKMIQNGSVWCAMHMQPIPPHIANTQLMREQTAVIAEAELRRRAQLNYSPTVDNTIESIFREQERVGFYGEPLCYLTTTFLVTAPDKASLDKRTTELATVMTAAGLTFYVAVFEQTKGFFSALPLANNTLAAHRRNVTPRTLAALMPSFNEEIIMSNGLIYGKDMTNGAAMVINPFGLQNPNSVIIGTPGAGKSFFLKSMCTQAVLAGARVFVLDIEGEYRALAQDLGGAYLEMTAKSKHKINVLDLDLTAESPFIDSYHAFKGWMNTVVGRALDAAEEKALDMAYVLAFERCGILKENPATYTLVPPLLSDLRAALEILRDQFAADEPATAHACNTLANALYSMSDGVYKEEFNVQSNINIGDANLIIFGLKNVGTDILTKRIRQIQSFIINQMLRDTKPKFVIYDEAWAFLRYPELAMHVEAEARRYRKKGGSLWLATQNVIDLTTSHYATTILNLAYTKIFFRQEYSSVDKLADLARLTPEERDLVCRLNPGEFLMHCGNYRRLACHEAPPGRYRLYTTKPSEVETA